jgi:putative nucleotidyltransferase with HDIG domain
MCPLTTRTDNQIPGGEQPPGIDRDATAERLLTLADEATRTFEFDRALGYLEALEQTWASKGVPEHHKDLQLRLFREKGRILAFQGKLLEAIEAYQTVLDACRDNKYLAIKSDTFTQIGQLLGKHGDYDRALGYHQRAIGACRRLDDTVGLCKALRNLGVIYVELGEFEEAEATYDEAISLASKSGEELLYADLVNNLGTIMNMRGEWQKALDLYRESLGIYRSGNEIRKSAYTMNNLAITFAERGYSDDAMSYFTQALDIAGEVNDASLILIVDINLADLYLNRRELERARYHCLRAEQYLQDNSLTNGHLVETRMTAGKIAFYELSFENSLQYFNDALHLAQDIGTQYQEAEVLFARGTLLDAMDRHFDALADLESSYSIFTAARAESKKTKTENAIASIEELYLKVFDALAQEVDEKDPYTKGHSDRVASLSLLLARELQLSTGTIKTVVAGALLHDIGKIKIDNCVLKKEGRLTDEEFAHIKEHANLGVALLDGKEFPWDVKPVIAHHHEKFDGTGYPDRLAGDDIPLSARVVCLADVFDALTSDRPYRAAFSAEQALKIMSDESGTSFDPELLATFVELIRTGKADSLINSRTDHHEMYRIWMRCLAQEDSEVIESESTAHTLLH